MLKYRHTYGHDTISELVADVEIRLIGPGAQVPEYSTPGAAGVDLRARLDKPIRLKPGDVKKIGVGIALDIKTPAIVAKVYPRSGQGTKGLVLANLTGVIDSDYQGEVIVSAWNRNPECGEDIIIENGDRIAQLVFEPVIHAEFRVVKEFAEKTVRGENGLGSTGINALEYPAKRGANS